MPVRSLNSAVLKWPGRDEVLSAAHRWATRLRATDARVESVYCVGSCARGDWGVGSDLDVIVIVREAPDSMVDRRRRYEPTDIPVAADLWVHTRAEWNSLAHHSPHLWKRLHAEKVDLVGA